MEFLVISSANYILSNTFILYCKSLDEDVFSTAKKTISIIPVFKKSNKMDIKNYRLISYVIQIGKLLENSS